MDFFESTILNRSFSDSNINQSAKFPIKRRIVVNEYVQYSNKTPLIRQYSCEEVYERCNDYSYCKERSINWPYTTSALEVVKQPQLEAIEYDAMTMPMEVDEDIKQLGESIKLRNDTVEQEEQTESTKKARKITINNYKKQKVSNDRAEENVIKMKKLITFKISLCIFIALLSMYYFIDNYQTCSLTKLPLDVIKKDLESEIFGQSTAINVILASIKSIETKTSSIKVLPFIGTTGVGKTYLANILKRYYVNYFYEVNKLQLHNFIMKEDLFKHFKSCTSNLLVIDNLHINSVDNVINFITSIPNNYKILIIVIFNTNVVDENLNYIFDIDKTSFIKDKFVRSKLNCDIVIFNNVTMVNLKEWMNNELTKLRTPVYKRDSMINNVLNNHDINRGFKGLHSKLILEVERN